MKTHELKTWPKWFRDLGPLAVAPKTFEVRRDDRGFEPGDLLNLREWNPDTQEYTGKEAHGVIGYVLRDAPGIEPLYCVMSVFVFHVTDRPAVTVAPINGSITV